MTEDPSLLLVLGLGAVCIFLFWQKKSRRSSQARASLKTFLDDSFEFQPTEDQPSDRNTNSKRPPLQNPFATDPRDEED